MSECAAILERLLDVDLEDLDPSADDEVARHLSACAGCSAAAERIRAAHAALDHVLGATPPVDATAIVARARLEALPTGDAMAAADGTPGPGRERPRPFPQWRRWLAIGVAASIGAALLLGERETPLPGTRIDSRQEVAVVVEAPSDRNVAVIQTENPDITVLWFF